MIKNSMSMIQRARETQEVGGDIITRSYSFCEICGSMTKIQNMNISHSQEECNFNITKEIIDS